MNDRPAFINPTVSHLEAAIDGTKLPVYKIQTLHKDRPLWVKYDLDMVAETFTKSNLATRPNSMWRYSELLPLYQKEQLITLGESFSPIMDCPTLSTKYGLSSLLVKDESMLPTGSFKARGLAMAVNMAAGFGVKRIAIPTAGNAGGALAAYAAKAGIEAFVFMPDDTPSVNKFETDLFGARTFLVNGLITDCGRIVREGKEQLGWFDMSTLKEPYRIEGKKTMGLELAEQLNWSLPDVILYPTGGGTGLIGMWKAFNELKQLGFISNLPKMVSVQSDGCSPIVRAWDNGERFAKPFENAHSVACGIRVPAAVGDFMILDALKESGGRAIAVEEKNIPRWMKTAASQTGISICPETATCFGALEKLIDENWISKDQQVLIFNTGAAQKYLEAAPPDLTRLDINIKVDYSQMI